MPTGPLPRPGSPELYDLPSAAHRELYRVLYERRNDPPTMNEVRDHFRLNYGSAPSQIDRRLRDLRSYFDIPAIRKNGDYVYPLLGWAQSEAVPREAISGRLRAQVLAPARCFQCGRTPAEDGVKLVVDHKIPVDWGGTNDPANLQPLCTQCNGEKQAFYATYDAYTDQIRAACAEREPHKRIGELLKAFNGGFVASDLIAMVASVGQYQEDWQKRTRELRLLGWDIRVQRQRDPDTGRTRSSYAAISFTPWPAGSVAREVRRRDPSSRSYEGPVN